MNSEMIGRGHYLILTHWISFKEKLSTATDFEDVAVLILQHTLALLLLCYLHTPCFASYCLGYDLLGCCRVRNLHCVLLPVTAGCNGPDTDQ